MATKTISQRITLIGGKEVSTELRNLGKAGEEAFKNIQASADKLKGPNASFAQSMKNISASLKTAGTNIAEFGRNTRQMGQTLSIVGAAVIGAGIAFGALVKHGADAATAMGENAQKAGTSIEAMGRLGFAANQAGVDTDSLVTAMGRFSKVLGEASEGTNKASVLFERLGIDIKGSGNKIRPVEEIMQDFAEVISKMPDGVEKTSLVLQVFGRAGAALIPMLNEGKEGMIAFGKEAERLGLLFSPEEFKIGDAFGDEVDKMLGSLQALGDHIGLVFAPALTELAMSITDFIAENKDELIAWAESIRDAFGALPEGVKIALAAIAGIVIVVGPALIALGAFIQVIGFSVSGLGNLARAVGWLATAFSGLVATVVRVAIGFGAMIAGMTPFGIIVGAIIIAVGLLALAIYKNWNKIKTVTVEMTQAFLRGMGSILESARQGAQAITQPFVDAFNAISDTISSIVDAVTDFLQTVIDKAVEAAQAVANVASGGDGAKDGGSVSAAGGGHIRGRGSSTSDSIPAWLSDGEFVIRAKAVRKYGAALFAALNSMKLQRKNIPFSSGGIARSLREGMSMPLVRGFAGGGSVASAAAGVKNLGSLNINFNGKGGTVFGPTEALEALMEAARDFEIASAGPAPAFVR